MKRPCSPDHPAAAHLREVDGSRADADPRLPLAGLRVLAVEQYGAGPFGTGYLADLGADVIKIERPDEGGDIGRRIGPHRLGDGDSQFFQTFNRNKRSLALDLTHPDGAAAFGRLVAGADAVLDNLRGDLPGRLGLTHAALARFNPRIVCAHLSAYGRDGSRAGWPGYDFLMQAEAGHLLLTGEPDAPPTRYGVSVVDYMTGLAAAFGLLAGVLQARRTGLGTDVDASLFDVALHNLAYTGTWYLNSGTVTGRSPRSAHPSLTPSQLFRTADGWIFVMCNKPKFWRRFATALGRPEWLDDPAFATDDARLANRVRLCSLIDAVLVTRETADWLEQFAGRIPAAPVHDVARALDSPFVRDGDRIDTFTGDGAEPLRLVANPLRFAGAARPTRRAPRFGADSRAVLREAGLADATITRLVAAGIVRDAALDPAPPPASSGSARRTGALPPSD